MALQGTISGNLNIAHGQPTVLTIAVIATDTNAAPTEPVTYEWHTDVGSFVGATDGASVTFLADIAGNAATTAEITCTVRDEHGAETVATAQITIMTVPPALDVIVPSPVEAGAEVLIQATAVGAGGAMITLLWESTRGGFADAAAVQTIWTAPLEPGEDTITCTATDEHGAQTVVTVDVEVRPRPVDGGLLIVQPVSIDSVRASTGVNNQANLFDGDPMTEATITSNNAHITIDMGSAVQIGAIRIKTDAASPLNLLWIQPSSSATSFPQADRANYAPGDGEWHVYRFGNISRRYWRLRFLRRAAGNYRIASIEFYRVIAPFDSPDTRPADFSVRQFDPRATQYRRYDRQLVSNNSPALRTELRVQWERLAQAHVDALESLYRSGDRFTVIPDVEFAPDKIYRVRWASPFTFPDSTRNWELGKSGQAVFQEVQEQLFRPVVQIEIGGQDLTDRWDPNDGLHLARSLDQQKLFRFQSGEVKFSLDNFDRHFDYANATNFFINNSLPAHGRGAKVLIKAGLSAANIVPMFAGTIIKVATNLNDTKAQVTASDLSAPLVENEIANFGQTLTRTITDFEEATLFYSEFNYVFNIPAWGLPVSRSSVAASIIEDGTLVPLNVVDSVATQGALSNRNIEIDYTTGQIRFEAAPKDGVDAEIQVTWKTDYRYKRPDFLIWQILKNTSIQDTLQITDDTQARFAIDQSLVRHPTDNVFSSHGRPFFQEHGIVRWQMLDDSGDYPEWWMAHDNRLVKYDEQLDEYEEVATVPDDDTITEVPPGGYGEELTSEEQSTPWQTRTGNRIYKIEGANGTTIGVYDLDGTRLDDESFGLVSTSSVLVTGPNVTPYTINWRRRYSNLSVFNGFLYIHTAYYTSFVRNNASTLSGTASGRTELIAVDLSTKQIDTTKTFTMRSLSGQSHTGSINFAPSTGYAGGDATPDGIYALISSGFSGGDKIQFWQHDGTRVQSTDIDLPDATYYGLDIRSDYAFVSANQDHDGTTGRFIRVFTHNAAELTHLSFEASGISNFIVTGNRLYAGNTQKVYSLAQSASYQSFVIYQFDTHDFENFYCLTTNTLKGDIRQDTSFNRVRVQKFDKSTGRWITLLDPDDGEPQLAHSVDLIAEIAEYADTRKNFEVIHRNNKTLIFYRRVQASAAGIAHYNETDDTLTNIYAESFGSNDGLPYSMDFVLDERTDGIYVYTFVVKYSVSGSTFSSATLKIYRKRVEPSASQAEIFSENFSGTSGTDEYPISVSSIILADDRSKFYFVLDYFSESSTEAGKSELCSIAKSGSGTRAVLKTYSNPLVGPRSPVKRGNDYFYLEGNWPRRPTDDADVPDKFYYPNEGGRLIEIETNSDITDHGIVWRSRSKLDSRDSDSENPQYDGYGLHNAVTANMVADSRGNLRFVAGYGVPYRITNNLPGADISRDIPDITNFNWIQFGPDLATKVFSFLTNEAKPWDVIQRLAQLMNWEIGFGPSKMKVDSVRDAMSTVSEWSANASMFFRPRTILPARLRTAIGASGTPSSIAINNNGIPAEVLEFPQPAAGERHAIIIDKEMFGYTTATVDRRGVVLTGISRSRYASAAAAHRVDAPVYFVDTFVSGEVGTSLVALNDRAPDFLQLFNDINVGFSDSIYNAKNQDSIDENGEHTLNIDAAQSLLGEQDGPWAEVAGDTYRDLLSEIKELIQFTMVFSPSIQPGQLIVFHQTERVMIEYTPFRVLRANHQIPSWQTSIVAKEI